MPEERKISVGKITGPHGLRGLVRLRSFTENPAAIETYPVVDAAGKSRRVTLKTAMGQEFIAEIEGVRSREQAEALRGQELFVPRSELPALGQREYYLADLVGLRALDQAHKDCGVVLAAHDFGGGPLLEIKATDGTTAMLPFRDAFVPVVDLAAGFVVIAPPEGWFNSKTDAAGTERSA